VEFRGLIRTFRRCPGDKQKDREDPMQYRQFGSTGMRLSAVGLGGLLAHYWEGDSAHPPAAEKRRIYLKAAELGINLFDMGYGDEVHIPDELKGPSDTRHFSLKVGAPKAEELEKVVDGHLTNLRREAIDILRVHHYGYMEDEPLQASIAQLKAAGKVRALCLIRHFDRDQQAYLQRGPEPDSDADLVIYNYVCRGQEPGIAQAGQAGKGVLVMKVLGGQYLSWAHKNSTDWTQATGETLMRLSPLGESMRHEIDLVYSFSAGPWRQLAGPDQASAPTGAAVAWVIKNPNVSSALVAVASVKELELALAHL
jgi:aryl-alcohol dehydrogenase-like predicted oxidoreductase